MTDDDLRAALAAVDPARSPDLDPLTFDPLTSPRARELLERAMTSDLSTPDLSTPDLDTTASTPPASPARPWRTPWLAAAAAAVVLAGGAFTYLAGGDDPAPSGGGELVLAAPGGDPISLSCLPVSAETLAAQSVALAGTVTAVSSGRVTLEVDRWYRGGDAATVVLTDAGPDLVALLGAPDFAVGQDYLVSGSQGTVSVCGLTGPASPELQAAYDEAFEG